MFNDPRMATSAAGGVVGALLIFITETLGYWNIHPSPSWVSAAGIILIAIAARWAHPAQEDLAALHHRILARLDAAEPPSEPATPSLSPTQQYAREASEFLAVLKRSNP